MGKTFFAFLLSYAQTDGSGPFRQCHDGPFLKIPALPYVYDEKINNFQCPLYTPYVYRSLRHVCIYNVCSLCTCVHKMYVYVRNIAMINDQKFCLQDIRGCDISKGASKL